MKSIETSGQRQTHQVTPRYPKRNNQLRRETASIVNFILSIFSANKQFQFDVMNALRFIKYALEQNLSLERVNNTSGSYRLDYSVAPSFPLAVLASNACFSNQTSTASYHE